MEPIEPGNEQGNSDGHFIAELLGILLADEDTNPAESVEPDKSLVGFLFRHIEHTIEDHAEIQNTAVELSLDHGHFYAGLQLCNALELVLSETEIDEAALNETALKETGYYQKHAILGRTCLARADTYGCHSLYPQAKQNCLCAIEHYEAIDDLISLGAALGQMAGMEEELNRKDEAISLLKSANRLLHKARKQAEKQNGTALEPLVKNYSFLGIIYNDEGDFYKADKYHNTSMRMIRHYAFSEVCNIEIMSNFARYQTALSHYGYAQKLYSEVLHLAEQNQLTELKMSSLHNLADIALIIDNLDQGRDQAQEALTLACLMDNSLEIARCLILLGLLHYRIALRDNLTFFTSLRCLLVAREHLQQIAETPALNAEICLSIAAIIQEQSPQKALNYYEQAKLGLNNYSHRSLLLANCANLYQNLGEPQQALSAFIQARKLIPNDAWKERAELYISIASYYYENYKSHKSLVYYQKALVMFRQIGTTVIAHKQQYVGSRTAFFHDAIAVALETKEPTKAYDFICMAKSQTFLDMLSQSQQLDSNTHIALIAKLERETDLATRINIQSQLEHLTGPLRINEQQEYADFDSVRRWL